MNTIFAMAIAVAPNDAELLKIIGGVLVFLLTMIVCRALFRPMEKETLLAFIPPEGILTSTLLEKVGKYHPFVTSKEVENLLQDSESKGFVETARSHHRHRMVKITNAGINYLRERAQED